MTLGDLTLPITYEEAHQYAMVFSVDLAQRLADIHSQHGTTNCVPVPTRLNDGRLMLGADLLTEVGSGGLLNAMWEAADKAILLPAVEVVPIADALALLPQPDPLP
jgi:hypothetical protein